MSEDSNSKRSRASGEVLDYLLREFDVNQNPNPDQRKDISERTGMTEKAVRIWFQNRRAKLRKFERLGKPVKQGSGAGVSPRGAPSGPPSRTNSLTNVSASALDQHSTVPNELNDKYCFIDCSSLSVGSWQRIKSGQHDHQALKTSLVNLSPFTLDQFMNTVDLMVILSKKNNEVNYFFAAISNNSKILFRIFYPISSVISSSLSENNISKENSELRLQLSHTPKFSVYFFSGINANLNQWSICDDFSEAQQVSSAYYAPGGTSTPHVLVGAKTSLDFLHQYLTTETQNPSQGFNAHTLSRFEHDAHGLTEEGSHTTGINDFEAGPTDYNHTEDAEFRLKQDTEWRASPSDDHNFAIKGISPLGEYEQQSQSPTGSQRSSVINVDSKFSTALTSKDTDFQGEASKKAESEYPDIFTETPDFFSTVQTPGSHQVSSHLSVQNHDNLINSPSTNIHHLVNPTENGNGRLKDTDIAQESRRPDDSQLDYSAPSFPSVVEQQEDVFNSGTPNRHDYGYGHLPGNDFQAHDLLLDSPSMASNNSNVGTSTQPGHEDQFIDYNGDA